MRQSHVVLLLVLLVLLGSFAIWMALQPEAPPTNAISNDAIHAPAGTQSASEQQPVPRKPEPPKAQPQTQPDPTTDDPVTERYTIRGRIALDESVKPVLRFMREPSEYSLLVGCYRQELEHPDTSEVFVTLKEDWSFEYLATADELGLEPEQSLTGLAWCVDLDLFNDPSFNTFGDNDSPVPPTGGVNVTPVIRGRHVDMGTISIGLDSMTTDKWVAVGRLVHTSGRALRYSGGHEVIFEGGDDTAWANDYEHFGTDHEGRFICPLYPAMSVDPTKCRFKIKLRGDLYDDLRGADEFKVPDPVITGHLIDCGDVKVGGSLLEIVANMDPVPPLKLNRAGALDIGHDGQYAGPQVVLDIWCSDLSLSEGIPPAPHSVVMWVPEGVYHYSAEATHGADYYLPVTGRIEVPHNAVVKLELSLKAAQTVPVRVLLPDGTQAVPNNMQWCMRTSEIVGHGSAENKTWRVPVREGAVTEVEAHVTDYESITGYTRPGDTELLLQLDKAKALANPDFGVAVKLPALPEGMDPEMFPCRIFVWHPEFHVQKPVTLQAQPGQVMHVALKGPGEFSVSLQGGEGWGYPTPLLSGPVNVEVAEGPFKEVELPPIPTPPWPARVTHVFASVKVGGHSAILSGVFLAADGSALGPLRLSDQFAVETGALPMFLRDGDQRIPLTYQPPPKDEPYGALLLEVPARIEVRVTRNGNPEKSFTAECTARPEGSAQAYGCDSAPIDGVSLLWAPAGAANVSVRVGIHTLQRDVTVTAGAVQRVEFTFDRVAVEFVLKDADNQPKGAPLWHILPYAEDGKLDPNDADELWGDEIRHLNAGRYRVLPAAGGKPEQAFDIDLSDGKDRTIELPSQADAVSARVRLSLPESLAKELGKDFWIQLSGLRMTDPESVRMARGYTTFAQEYQCRVVPGGVLVTGLHVGADVCLWGRIEISKDEEEVSWLLKPLRLKVAGDDMNVAVQWVKPVPLHEHWDIVYTRYASVVEGCLLPLEMDHGALPGNHEIVFLYEGEIVHREWITFAGDKPVRLPQSVISALVAREIAEPEDFEDPPEED
ncbi:MAG: hypothetical protein KF696_15675 [Planctomycetes bacterium]|nr:hypothetical protein [Planctomycetota bacterium]MCW8136253.1 hypothetical protein [Planctomycetota bacterium]